MDYMYEVDLANGKTVKVTHPEKKDNIFLLFSDGKNIEDNRESKALGAYTAEKWIAKAKKSPPSWIRMATLTHQMQLFLQDW